MSTSRNGARASSTARCASQPPSISTPVSQRRLPRMRLASACSAAASLRTSTRVKRSSVSCSQYQSDVRPSNAGAAANCRRAVARFLGERFAAFAIAPFRTPATSLLDVYPCVQRILPLRKVRDGIGIVGEKWHFFLPGEKYALFLLHQMPHAQHAQADSQGVVEVAARDVDVRASGLEALEQPPDLALELELGERAL